MPISNYLQSTVAMPSRYQRWGIAIPKEIIFAYGGRPVLYSDLNFYERLKATILRDDSDKYRFLFSNHSPLGNSDWTHEREWRVLPNAEFNNKIGMTDDEFNYIYGGRISGKSLVPIHLPKINKSELDYKLTEEPQFILLVDTEDDVEKVKKPRPPGLVEFLAEKFSSISEYREKYLIALQQARVISFEHIRDERDGKGFWRLEDFIGSSKNSQSQIAILWNRASTKTRRKALQYIHVEQDKGYEYYQWQDFLSWNGGLLAERQLGIQELIAESKDVTSLLEKDATEWVEEFQRSIKVKRSFIAQIKSLPFGFKVLLERLLKLSSNIR